ncbi:hypothetical protein [Dulcicalothrix desertica]|nr:hypothetical protein [Dulcicalothrix desertica]
MSLPKLNAPTSTRPQIAGLIPSSNILTGRRLVSEELGIALFYRII